MQHEAEQSDFSATVQLEQLGQVTVGITRADGLKCARYFRAASALGQPSPLCFAVLQVS